MGIKKLERLDELVIKENLFREIPFNRLSKNKSNQIVSFSRTHIDLQPNKGRHKNLSFSSIFKLNNVKLERIDPSFYLMSGLIEFQLQENKLSEIPKGIEKLRNLEKLSFTQMARGRYQ